MKTYQINLRITEDMKNKLEENVAKYGYSNTQDLIKETLRRELYENDKEIENAFSLAGEDIEEFIEAQSEVALKND